DLVTWRGPDGHPVWSPDGARIAFETAAESPDYYYANGVIGIVPASGGTPTVMTRQFDEDMSLVAWTSMGVWFSANVTTGAYLHVYDLNAHTNGLVAPANGWAGSGWHVSRDGRHVTYVAGDATHYPEVYAGSGAVSKAVTHMSDQLEGWTLGT